MINAAPTKRTLRQRLADLHVHRFAIDERARRPRPGELVHWRGFITVREHEDGKQLFGGRLEVHLGAHFHDAFAVRFHAGTLGSETPFDGHLCILGAEVYWGLENGRHFANWLTHLAGEKHRYDGRDLQIRMGKLAGLGNGDLSWTLWTHSDRYERDEFASWREGRLKLDLLEQIWGPKNYTYEDLATAAFVVDMPEGSYPVVVTLQQQTRKRTKSKRIIEQYLTLDVHANHGIPYRYDSSGGWKGDRVYGFHVRFKMPRKADWQIDAKAAVTAWVYQHRADSGFRKAQEEQR